MYRHRTKRRSILYEQAFYLNGTSIWSTLTALPVHSYVRLGRYYSNNRFERCYDYSAWVCASIRPKLARVRQGELRLQQQSLRTPRLCPLAWAEHGMCVLSTQRRVEITLSSYSIFCPDWWSAVAVFALPCEPGWPVLISPILSAAPENKVYVPAKLARYRHMEVLLSCCAAFVLLLWPAVHSSGWKNTLVDEESNWGSKTKWIWRKCYTTPKHGTGTRYG